MPRGWWRPVSALPAISRDALRCVKRGDAGRSVTIGNKQSPSDDERPSCGSSRRPQAARRVGARRCCNSVWTELTVANELLADGLRHRLTGLELGSGKRGRPAFRLPPDRATIAYASPRSRRNVRWRGLPADGQARARSPSPRSLASASRRSRPLRIPLPSATRDSPTGARRCRPWSRAASAPRRSSRTDGRCGRRSARSR